MADFCKQCTIENFGEHQECDLAGLQTAELTEAGWWTPALCEGCGPTMVDHEGRCLTDCALHHKPETSNVN